MEHRGWSHQRKPSPSPRSRHDSPSLPDELILTSYLTVRDGKIVTLIIIRNTPASY